MPRDPTAPTGETPGAGAPPRASTRERILEVALELFVDQGYDGTSLRDIAKRLGVTKAALYYHFERKDDIFLALHLRAHELLRDVLVPLDEAPDDRARSDAWPAVLERFVDRAVEHPRLVLLHVRNPGALAAVVDDDRNRSENEDFQQRTLRLLQSAEVPIERRVRMACALGAVVGGLAAFGGAQEETAVPELAEHVRSAVADVLRRPGA